MPWSDHPLSWLSELLLGALIGVTVLWGVLGAPW
jgi:hypothetical protein